MDDRNELSILKKVNKYMLLSTSALRFVDILNFSPLKCSLRKFYDTFLVPSDGDGGSTNLQGKGVFPYSYVRSANQLSDSVDRIKYKHFNDVLQGKNALNLPYSDYCRLIKQGHNEKSALKLLGGLNERPLSGESVMARLRVEWCRRGFVTVKDLMEDYSLKDVSPLFTSVVQFLGAFRTLKLGDMLHQYVSLAQASYTFFMDSCASSRHFCGLTQNLYSSFRSYLVGGPAVAYTRYMRCGETRCREEELSQSEAETIESIFCLDVTSHYANCMREIEMPIGLYQLRRSEDNFKGQFVNHRIHESLYWIGWLRATKLKHATKLRTLLNEGEVLLELASNGKRVRFDAMWIDDTNDERLSAAEYLECNGIDGKQLSSHGLCPECADQMIKIKGRPESKKSFMLRQKTMNRLTAIAADPNVRRVIYEWQCKWIEEKKRNPQAADFCARFQPWQGCRETYTDRDSLVEDILDGKITGLVLCTIGVAQRRR
ncbi:MAG: hypothetical protein GY740_23035, partial [Gammaproteobacteria bacterium]|nr:hypothetical protein [Gammaproteobacteria bacterium]